MTIPYGYKYWMSNALCLLIGLITILGCRRVKEPAAATEVLTTKSGNCGKGVFFEFFRVLAVKANRN